MAKSLSRQYHLTKRRDYTRVQACRRPVRGRLLLMTYAPWPASEGDQAASLPGPRAGFTISRKVGNAVVRNRVKRRLKALWAAHRERFAGQDWVFIAFAAAAQASFAQLSEDFLWLCSRAPAPCGASGRWPGC